MSAIATDFTLRNTTGTMTPNQTKTISVDFTPACTTIKALNWTSNNTNVAIISCDGVLTARGAGTATITAKTKDGSNISKQFNVTVSAGSIPVTGVSIPFSCIFMERNQTRGLCATISPSNATNRAITWSSSNNLVATVTQTGVVRAVSPGSAVVTVTSIDGGHKSTCKISVTINKTTMLNNFANNTPHNVPADRKSTMLAIGYLMLNEGFEASFIAGMMANVQFEGNSGQFESSNFISNPNAKPDYLAYMDGKYSYNSEYSGQNIVNKDLLTVRDMLLELEPNNWRCPNTNSRRGFGLGAIQWTFIRTLYLVNTYLEVTGGVRTISNIQVNEAEGIMICRELKNPPKQGVADYRTIHPNWQTANNGSVESENAAYDAASRLCKSYIRPPDMNNEAQRRGEAARAIYKIMLG
ncbi:MAG: phage tail tip lysozyme [Oscillospiraceae bacterium]|nr:phage tail tip lysozyme [Oscillospiraceae bacterium]